MDIYISYWMNRAVPTDHPTLVKKEVEFTGYNNELVKEELYFITVEDLEALLGLCVMEEGFVLRPPSKDFPYWSMIVDDEGKSTIC